MLCFVDESGDTGLRVEKGSSKFFTVALVIFHDNDEANACDQRIGLLRRELGLQTDYEFHYSETPKRIKLEFYKAVVLYNFFYLTFTINKAAIYGEGFKYKKSFYKYACSLVFENAKSHLDNAIVIFDGSGSREFKKELQSYLKKKINEKDNTRIRKVKVQDSHKNNLIQLADMICGAVVQSFKKRDKQRTDYRKMMSHREISGQVWPREINDMKRNEYNNRRKRK